MIFLASAVFWALPLRSKACVLQTEALEKIDIAMLLFIPLAKLLCAPLSDKDKVYFFESTFQVRDNARNAESPKF